MVGLDPTGTCLGHVPWVGSVASGSGWSSRLAVRTGRLRSSRTVHARPIDLVIFQEPSGQ